MNRTYIIAEAGVNHNGSVKRAKKMVDIAANAGADAVKFQTFKAETLVTKDLDKAEYQKRNLGTSITQFQMLKKLELPFEAYYELKNYCTQRKIEFLSTPFDEESAKFLVEKVKIRKIKIPSGEITNLLFLKYLASFNLPVIMSTGMSTTDEIQNAMKVLLSRLPKSKITLLHCTSNYPCPFTEVNLKAMLTLKNEFDVTVGYSDHTLGIEVPIAATALGATVIEKHFTLDRTLKGPDHKASATPEELKEMISTIRNIEKALGDGLKKPTANELKIRKMIRKKIVAAQTIEAGQSLAEKNLSAKRARLGIEPTEYKSLIGLKLIRKKQCGEPILWSDVKNAS
jgi:N-acetylneuraminate synthase